MPHAEALYEIGRVCALVFAKHNIKRAGLFGSFARGEETSKSDYDFVLEFRGSASLFKLGAVKDDLEHLLGRPCDVLTYSCLNADDGELSSIIKKEVRTIYSAF